MTSELHIAASLAGTTERGAFIVFLLLVPVVAIALCAWLDP